MDHLQESGASVHRRRRRRRAAITLTLVTLLLLGTFAYAAAYFQGWLGNRSVAEPVTSSTCQPVVTPVKALAPKAVIVNVYNATSREGLAASVAKSLQAQGFKVAKITNDPLDRSIKGVGEVRHGPKGAAAAAVATSRLSGAGVLVDKRADATVDVVLGNAFRALSAPPKVPALTASRATPSPSRSC